MKRSGKGAWPIALFLIVLIAGAGVYLFPRTVWVDKSVAVTPYSCGNGVNIIVVSDPYAASNYRGITYAVGQAMNGGGGNASIIFVTGEFDEGKGSHIDALFQSLSGLGAKAIYAYPTNLDDFKSDYAVDLHGKTDTVELKENAVSSASVGMQRKSGLLSTQRKAAEDMEDVLQVWDIEQYERRDVELSKASVKVLIGGVDKERIGCDVYIYAEGGKEFSFEENQARLFVNCGVSGAQSTDSFYVRHAVGVIEIANMGEE